jgi:hypothetical protein
MHELGPMLLGAFSQQAASADKPARLTRADSGPYQ